MDTGQRSLDEGMGGLMDYRAASPKWNGGDNARFYNPYLNRFSQPDSIVPEPGNPQSFNKYSYVNNRPIILNDPSGHMAAKGAGVGGGNVTRFGYCVLYPHQCGGTYNDPSAVPPHKFVPNAYDAPRYNLPKTKPNLFIPGRPAYNWSIRFQDVGTALSTAGSAIEAFGFAAFGSVGFAGANGLYQGSLGRAEQALGWASIGATFIDDVFYTGNSRREGNTIVISESLATSLVTQGIGHYNEIATVDAVLDIYSSAYIRGEAPGIYDLVENKTGKMVHGTTTSITIPIPLGIVPIVPIYGKATLFNIQWGD